MKDFELIYKLLKIYRDALWKDGVTLDDLMPNNLGASETHVRNIQLVLRNAGLIVGTNGETVITLAGLEYLESNPQMAKLAGNRKPYSYGNG